MSRFPTVNIDYTSRDYEAFRDMMITKLQEKMPEYTDTSETDAGIVILEALANGLDILSLYMDVIANDVLLPTTQDRKIAIMLARCLGYTPYNHTASEHTQVFVLEEAMSEDVIIPKGTVVRTEDSSDVEAVYFETEEDLKIPSGCLGNERGEGGSYKYHVKVKQGISINEDVIGTSSGAPLQEFQLNYTGALVDSIELYVNEGDGEELWTMVDSFIDCDENSKVYMVSIDEFDVCTIEFGNGIKGKIPKSYPNGIVAYYRIGGGEVGNLSPNTITEIDSDIPYVGETFNINLLVKGYDKESLESIKENAIANYRVRDRIVTLNDYSDIIRINFKEFLSLKSVIDSDDRKEVDIYYMMKEDKDLSSDLSQEVAEFVSERSMIGTTFSLNRYVEQEVDLECVMYVDSDFNGNDLKEDVMTYLDTVTFSYGELQFGDSIVKSDLESEIKDTFDGVISFRINSPTEHIISPTSPQNVLVKGTVNITLKYL